MFCSMLSILVLISIGRYLLGGFDTDEIEGIITGLGGYRYAVVQAGAMVMGLVCAIFLSCIDYRALVRIWPVLMTSSFWLLPNLLICWDLPSRLPTISLMSKVLRRSLASR